MDKQSKSVAGIMLAILVGASILLVSMGYVARNACAEMVCNDSGCYPAESGTSTYQSGDYYWDNQGNSTIRSGDTYFHNDGSTTLCSGSYCWRN